MKVLHVLYNYYPDLTGSTIRSEGVLNGQLGNNINVIAITSPFQPGFTNNKCEKIGFHKIYRSKNYLSNDLVISEKPKGFITKFKKALMILSFSKVIYEIAKEEDIDVIHAHSTFICALASFFASRKLKIKYIYEFRSLWEERAKNTNILNRFIALIIRFMETLSLKLADHIVTINEGLKEEITSRHINANKVTVVTNAVDNNLIKIGAGFNNPRKIKNFAYVGNFSSIEGLELLIDSFISTFTKKEDVTLNFYGRGPLEEKIKNKILQLNDDRILFHGGFSRDDISDIYSKIDCIVIPRLNLAITQKVTPLKPLEAMAFKRLVIGSDVNGITEVINSKDNALIFKADNIKSLNETLRFAFENDCSSYINNAYDFVTNHRTWNGVSKKYADLYNGEL
ncbi:glycosyltransferase family 4 protein [Photobacterium leiognathi]|uniref:glycosyltransferase family 4 protein n=1 Tax=Photobacterium leiognathi TaxID=553611 RepID=UPI0029825BFA|nr:glycosyltransferase family 4 protein [Photobacterium leiognathi]